ncbi:flagellar brake protein [Denitromonas ohlonensis]|jgi:c-di-GMP-binding flagellar brake protein YcgR|uniref:Flagellar brake protein YcgR n=2 Tax=Denitromonas TaxID=139331 RepID=A0A557R420_9RHOO|nr:flagellar brake protein [Denitromonas ohlonensis]TVO59907.1 flagellar brake protein [Denitromonas ohlonensis]TVO71162.1 flagellar brake protein [Denitromonas ohlonensis]TVT48323.1 MAG: flagellar brake protein [Denitromonas halophila]TVT67568.1 MAG: flagellar brake protein [Denitromonas halophila]
MTQTDNAALKFELLQSDDFGRYLLRDRNEIIQVLRQLIAKRAMVTAYLSGGRDFLLTAVLAIEDEDLILDVAPDENRNRQAEAAEELICITQIENVKVQFPIPGITSTQFEGAPAFRAPLPDRLLRLQRREYYRLIAPVAHSLICQIPVPAEDGPTNTFEARVLDISGGGVAVIVPPEGVEFKPDTEFTQCQIQLPEIGTVQARLRVRNLFRVTNRNGISMLRAGCEFVDLPERVASVIHRYILKVERDRNSRERRL